MPMRNAQNPIKMGKSFGGAALANEKTGPASKIGGKGGEGHCPACGAAVPPKPGFRFSSLVCPKCGASMGKK